MRFTASLALAAAAVVPAVLAQSVTINLNTPLTQCATSTITFDGSTGPYYVAVVPSSDPCTEDALAEFYDVESGSQDYYVNQPSGTSVQIYVMDVNGVENWSQIYTVGDGDNSCLGGSDAAAQAPADTPATSSDPATTPATTPTPDAAATSSTSAPALYVPPSASTTAAALTYANTGSGNIGSSGSSNSGSSSSTDNSGSDVAPANAANDSSANGASSLSASVTLLVGAFAAVVALF